MELLFLKIWKEKVFRYHLSLHAFYQSFETVNVSFSSFCFSYLGLIIMLSDLANIFVFPCLDQAKYDSKFQCYAFWLCLCKWLIFPPPSRFSGVNLRILEKSFYGGGSAFRREALIFFSFFEGGGVLNLYKNVNSTPSKNIAM